jgi:hypothetical protein
MTGSFVNFLPTTTLKRFKDNENIPKYSFKFMSTNMRSIRINVDTYLSGKTLLTLQFLHFHSFCDHLTIIYIYVFIDFIGVTTHVGPVEKTGTNFGFIGS